MNKYILTFLSLALLSVQPVSAANLSVKLSQPKSPSRINSFKITFVALDTEDRPVTVRCMKKSPSDSGFVRFGSDFNLSIGGNTDSCLVDSSVLNTQGTFQFKVAAADGVESLDSNIVTVEYKTDGPNMPTSYSKEKINDCTWKIKFTAGQDGGKTKRIEVYRSDNKSFNADSGNMFANIFINSGENGEASITVPDCGKTWYFAVRAFDDAGNGSGVLGDSETITTTSTSSETKTNTGAIALSSVANSSIGDGVSPTEGTKDETINSDGTKQDGGSDSQPEVKGSSTTKGSKLFLEILAGLSVIAVYYVFFKKGKK